MSYKDLDNLDREGVVKITSLTDSHDGKQGECVLETIIQMQDGSFHKIVVPEEERAQATRAIEDFAYDVADAQGLDPNQLVGTLFFQREKGYAADLDEYNKEDSKYNDYSSTLSRGKNIKRAVAAAGVLGGIAITATACSNIAKQQKEKNVEQETETTVVKPEIKGTSWDNYVNVAPEGIQKEFMQKENDLTERLNNAAKTVNYTYEDGTRCQLGFCVEEVRTLLLALNDFSYTYEYVDENGVSQKVELTNNDVWMFIMNGESLDSINVVRDGETVTEDYETVLHKAFEKFTLLFNTVSVDPNLVADLFDDSVDRDLIVQAIEGHNKVLNATTEDERKNAAVEQRKWWENTYAMNASGTDARFGRSSTAFLTRALYTSDVMLAQAYNYTGTADIYRVSDGKRVEVTTNLYGEEFNAFMEGGLTHFDKDSTLKKYGKDPDDYYFWTVEMGPDFMSVASNSCDSVFENFTEYQNYLKTVDSVRTLLETGGTVSADDALERLHEKFASGQELTEDDFNLMSVTQEYDTIKAKLQVMEAQCYPVADIEDLMRSRLMSMDLYPVNADDRIWKYWENKQEGILNSLSSGKVTSSSTGSKKSTGKTTYKGTDAKAAEQALVNAGMTPEEATAARIKAEDEAMARQGILGRADDPETDKKAMAEAQKAQAQAQITYNEVYYQSYNYWLQQWKNSYGQNNTPPSFESQYLNNTSFVSDSLQNREVTIRDAYLDGKNNAWKDYLTWEVEQGLNGNEKLEEQAEERGNITGGETKIDDSLKDYIEDGSISTDPGDSNGQTVQDVKDQYNGEDSDKNIKEPVITPSNPAPTPPPAAPTTPSPAPAPEQNTQPQANPQDELPPGFKPFVDPSSTGNGETNYWSEQDILDHAFPEAQSQSVDSVPAADTPVESTPAAEITESNAPVVEESTGTPAVETEGGEIQINPEFEGVDMGDISTDPEASNISFDDELINQLIELDSQENVEEEASVKTL